jgi:hypothetical protein
MDVEKSNKEIELVVIVCYAPYVVFYFEVVVMVESAATAILLNCY